MTTDIPTKGVLVTDRPVTVRNGKTQSAPAPRRRFIEVITALHGDAMRGGYPQMPFHAPQWNPAVVR